VANRIRAAAVFMIIIVNYILETIMVYLTEKECHQSLSAKKTSLAAEKAQEIEDLSKDIAELNKDILEAEEPTTS